MMPPEFDITGKVVFITGAGAASARASPRCSPKPAPTSP